MHCLLKGIKTYRILKKLDTFASATAYLECERNRERITEIDDAKQISYYVFEKKEESYVKNEKEVKYSRTARTPRKKGDFEIVRRMVDAGQVYLRHQSHVENINKIFSQIKQPFKGNIIKLNFSENISEKLQQKVKSAQFSEIQYKLHCSAVEPGKEKYVYHLSDETTYDSSFVESVLEDIFGKRGINHGIVMIKSDNAPTQYKNKQAFGSMQHLADKYSVTIVRVNSVSGHGKGLIDTISSFGVKNILRQGIITNE